MSALLSAYALELAVGDLGVKEEPPGSNRGPRIDRYAIDLGYDMGRPWCALFVSWIIREAGLQIPMPLKFRGSASCLRLVELNQELQMPTAEPLCIFVNLEPSTKGHCGFVTEVTDDGVLLTIEGNTDASGSRTGGQVMRQRRAGDYPEAYIRIA